MAYFDHFAKIEATGISDFFAAFKIRKQFEIIKTFIKDKGKESRILEVGPGKGKLALKFIRNGYRNYDAVEPNEVMGDNLIKRGVKNVKRYMAPRLKEEDRSYDLIIAFDLLEHLNGAEDARVFISEIYRVLKKNGVAAILSPDYLNWKEDFFNCDFSHSYVTTARRMIQLLYNNNIRPLKIYYFSFLFTGFAAYIVSFFVRIIFFFPRGNGINCRLYKLKLTLLRRFLVVGRKDEIFH